MHLHFSSPATLDARLIARAISLSVVTLAPDNAGVVPMQACSWFASAGVDQAGEIES
jgi:hypothetical protein